MKKGLVEAILEANLRSQDDPSDAAIVRALTGPEGPIGPVGPEGPRGTTGQDGQDGQDGAQGVPGEKGDRGERGATGPTGPQGEQGVTSPGRQGPPGPRGLPGPAGTGGTGPGGSPLTVADSATTVQNVTKQNFQGTNIVTLGNPGEAIITLPSGLPPNGTVGQVVTNTAPGVGDWEDAASGGVAAFVQPTTATPEAICLALIAAGLMDAPLVTYGGEQLTYGGLPVVYGG